MCRLLIYNPGVKASWRATPEAALLRLGQVEREWEELIKGICWGLATPLRQMSVAEAACLPLTEVGVIPGPLAKVAPDAATLLWQALSLVADYGRLVVVGSGEELTLYRYQPPTEDASCDYLYHPHPGRLVSGRYAEVFAPSNPDALICACTLGDEVYWDEDERAEVLAFRGEVGEVVAQVVRQAEVTFIDSDGWYAEL